MYFGVNGGIIEVFMVIVVLGLKFKISFRFMVFYGYVICCLKRSMFCLCFNFNYVIGVVVFGIY